MIRKLTHEEIALIRQSQKRGGGSGASQLTLELISQFKNMSVGDALAVEVPEGKDPQNFRNNLNATLVRYKIKGRRVSVDPNTKQVMIEKISA